MKIDRTTLLLLLVLGAPACTKAAKSDNPRVSGQVEATEVQVAAEVGGRVLAIPVVEGDRIRKGDLIATLDTRDADLALQRANAEREQADAQLRLLLAGSRAEDISQAQAQMNTISEHLAQAYPARQQQGFCLWFTGLPCAAIRPAKPLPTGICTPCWTSSSSPLAAVATSWRDRRSSSKIAAVSASRASLTRPTSTSSKARGSSMDNAASVIDWTL